MGRSFVRRLSAGFGFQANLDGKCPAVVDIGRVEVADGSFTFAN
jgi:hypothetical protein